MEEESDIWYIDESISYAALVLELPQVRCILSNYQHKWNFNTQLFWVTFLHDKSSVPAVNVYIKQKF